MKFDFVSNDATIRTTFDKVEDIPFEQTGVVVSNSCREELRGQPKFDGWYGPMWGGHRDENGEYVFDGSGTPHIRYESRDSYDFLSR